MARILLNLSRHPFNRPLLSVNSLDSIQCLHRADACRFLLLDEHWCGESIWVLPYSNSCARHFLLVLRGWFLQVSLSTPLIRYKTAVQLLFCGELLSGFVQKSVLYSCVVTMWCKHTVLLSFGTSNKSVLLFLIDIFQTIPHLSPPFCPSLGINVPIGQSPWHQEIKKDP